MTLKELAAELYTPMKDLKAWIKESNLDNYELEKHDPAAAPGTLSDDGIALIRDLHLRKTHPEVGQRIDNLIMSLFDMRKLHTEQDNIIRILTEKRGS